MTPDMMTRVEMPEIFSPEPQEATALSAKWIDTNFPHLRRNDISREPLVRKSKEFLEISGRFNVAVALVRKDSILEFWKEREN